MPLFTKADPVLAIRLEHDVTVAFEKDGEPRPKTFKRGDWLVINERGQGKQYYLNNEVFCALYRPLDEDARLYLSNAA